MLPHNLYHVCCRSGRYCEEDVNNLPLFCFRHSRAYLHALFKSDTAAMHHITIHNIAYQVSIGIVSYHNTELNSDKHFTP